MADRQQMPLIRSERRVSTFTRQPSSARTWGIQRQQKTLASDSWQEQAVRRRRVDKSVASPINLANDSARVGIPYTECRIAERVADHRPPVGRQLDLENILSLFVVIPVDLSDPPIEAAVDGMRLDIGIILPANV